MITRYDASNGGGGFIGVLDFRTITNPEHSALAERIRKVVKRAKVGPIVILQFDSDGRYDVWTRHPRRHFDVHYAGSIRDGVLRFDGRVVENA